MVIYAALPKQLTIFDTHLFWSKFPSLISLKFMIDSDTKASGGREEAIADLSRAYPIKCIPELDLKKKLPRIKVSKLKAKRLFFVELLRSYGSGKCNTRFDPSEKRKGYPAIKEMAPHSTDHLYDYHAW
jgi:hypothetical protein